MAGQPIRHNDGLARRVILGWIYFSFERTGIAIASGCWVAAKLRSPITKTVAINPKSELKDRVNKVSISFDRFFD